MVEGRRSRTLWRWTCSFALSRITIRTRMMLPLGCRTWQASLSLTSKWIRIGQGLSSRVVVGSTIKEIESLWEILKHSGPTSPSLRLAGTTRAQLPRTMLWGAVTICTLQSPQILWTKSGSLRKWLKYKRVLVSQRACSCWSRLINTASLGSTPRHTTTMGIHKISSASQILITQKIKLELQRILLTCQAAPDLFTKGGLMEARGRERQSQPTTPCSKSWDQMATQFFHQRVLAQTLWQRGSLFKCKLVYWINFYIGMSEARGEMLSCPIASRRRSSRTHWSPSKKDSDPLKEARPWFSIRPSTTRTEGE